ncbi:hypothetical protein [Maribacter sp. Hel_I_7]|uniref:hypothetical protein n=1 Tax=Maribacter sp. Hel_I_7 TaxID=1249997 RepID=UPI00047DECFA|nr:hypothetical protein [Maribacter sp. Hel_I_7]
MEKSTFQNLVVLKNVQKSVKKKLGSDYNSKIKPFVDIIDKVMVNNNINEFEALKLIKDELSIYKKSGAPQFFSAALIEITQSKHFTGFKDK